MMKKLLLILCFILCMSGMTVFGTEPKDADYNGLSYEQLRQQSEKIFQSLETMDEETKLQIAASQDEKSIQFIRSFDELRSKSGAFKEIENFKITNTDKTVTTEQQNKYENYSITVTIIYDTMDQEKMPEITVDRTYSIGEKMQKALMNCLMGMGTVFFMLILISGIISCFRIIPYLEKKSKDKNVSPVDKFDESVLIKEELMKEQDDLELTAVIAAAIAASTGQSTDDFVVRSIQRR